MGFRVEIGPNATAISKLLKGSPYAIFKQPFAGYLLFLFDYVSEDDVAFKNWFEKHVEPLHVMTGEEIAFAVFAHRHVLKVHVPHSRPGRLPETKEVHIGDSDPDFNIQSLARSGRCGLVVDGDEIKAVNEAVYELAREFGVLHLLPCIIAIDGLPDPRLPWKCFPSSEYDLHAIFGQLRKAVGKLHVLPNLSAYQHGLQAIRDEVTRRNKAILKVAPSAQHLAQMDLNIHNAARSVLAMRDRPSWCRILEEELTPGCSTEMTDERSQPYPSATVERLLDWADLPESLTHLRKMNFLGLLRSLRRLISIFGHAIWTRCPTAFASYASSDRQEVIRRVQGMRAFQPALDVFIDFHSLYPGEVWKERLGEEIEHRDRFFLFWSQAASESKYVAEEYHAALRCGKPITPVPLCSPQQVPPPRELEHLHFNDLYVEFLHCAQLAEPKHA